MSPATQSSPPGPAPKRLVRQGRELLREASILLKRHRKRISASARLEVEGGLDTLHALVGKRHAAPDEAQLTRALEGLDEAVQRHLGAFRKSWVREYVEAIAWAIVLALIIRSFIFEAFSIPSGSMLPTLEIGDRLFVNKIGYGAYVPFSPRRLVHWDEPDRGDIIVFEFHCEGVRNDGEDYIKRVVATAGDRVRLESNVIWVNGEPIATRLDKETDCDVFEDSRTGGMIAAGSCECSRQIETAASGAEYVTQHMSPGQYGPCDNHPDWPHKQPTKFGRCNYFGHAAMNENWPDVVVPPGHVFVMGDNRDRSEDGRYWGLVPHEMIKGTAFVVWWPPSRLGTWLR